MLPGVQPLSEWLGVTIGSPEAAEMRLVLALLPRPTPQPVDTGCYRLQLKLIAQRRGNGLVRYVRVPAHSASCTLRFTLGTGSAVASDLLTHATSTFLAMSPQTAFWGILRLSLAILRSKLLVVRSAYHLALSIASFLWLYCT